MKSGAFFCLDPKVFRLINTELNKSEIKRHNINTYERGYDGDIFCDTTVKVSLMRESSSLKEVQYFEVKFINLVKVCKQLLDSKQIEYNPDTHKFIKNVMVSFINFITLAWPSIFVRFKIFTWIF